MSDFGEWQYECRRCIGVGIYTIYNTDNDDLDELGGLTCSECGGTGFEPVESGGSNG